MVEKDELPALFRELSPDLVATVGAGDIDRMVLPIRDLMKESA